MNDEGGKAHKLPPLPGSMPEDLKRNEFHPFYKKTPKEVWIAAEIEHPKITDKGKCIHNFQFTKDGVRCDWCHMGLIGEGFDIQEGKLFYKGMKVF